MRGLEIAPTLLLAVACGGSVSGGGSGGAAGTSSGGTSSGGSSSGGASSGGTSSGGTSSGGSSSGGASSGGTSSGGTSSGGSSSGGASSGGSGGTTASCTSYTECCHDACTMIAGAPPCPGGGAECSCNASGASADCVSRLADVYRCVLGVGPGALKCDQNGKLALRCGVCTSEMTAAAAACGGGDFKCAY